MTNFLDIVELKYDIKEKKLLKGARGTIVEIYKDGAAYEVEFFDSEGNTVDVLTVKPSDISLIKSDKIKEDDKILTLISSPVVEFEIKFKNENYNVRTNSAYNKNSVYRVNSNFI